LKTPEFVDYTQGEPEKRTNDKRKKDSDSESRVSDSEEEVIAPVKWSEMDLDYDDWDPAALLKMTTGAPKPAKSEAGKRAKTDFDGILAEEEAPEIRLRNVFEGSRSVRETQKPDTIKAMVSKDVQDFFKDKLQLKPKGATSRMEIIEEDTPFDYQAAEEAIGAYGSEEAVVKAPQTELQKSSEEEREVLSNESRVQDSDDEERPGSVDIEPYEIDEQRGHVEGSKVEDFDGDETLDFNTVPETEGGEVVRSVEAKANDLDATKFLVANVTFTRLSNRVVIPNIENCKSILSFTYTIQNRLKNKDYTISYGGAVKLMGYVYLSVNLHTMIKDDGLATQFYYYTTKLEQSMDDMATSLLRINGVIPNTKRVVFWDDFVDDTGVENARQFFKLLVQLQESRGDRGRQSLWAKVNEAINVLAKNPNTRRGKVDVENLISQATAIGSVRMKTSTVRDKLLERAEEDEEELQETKSERRDKLNEEANASHRRTVFKAKTDQ